MKSSHKVQSCRSVVERMFASLKKWEVLFGSDVDSIEKLEKELDCAMALHNLIILQREDMMHMIPARAKFSKNAHIITPSLEPSMKFPPKLALESPKVPVHVKEFHVALAQLSPMIVKLLEATGRDQIFTGRVAKRGLNLWEAGNVLQIMVERHELDNWWIRFSVGASIKFPTYKCYCVLNHISGLVKFICECKGG